MIPWAHQRPQRERHLDRFIRFCRAHYCDRQTGWLNKSPWDSVYNNRRHLRIQHRYGDVA